MLAPAAVRGEYHGQEPRASRRPAAGGISRREPAGGRTHRPLGSAHRLRPRRQLAALTTAGCLRIFADKKSGKTAEREELWKALDYLRPGDTLVVPSLDRLGRSLQDLISIVAGLRKRGVGFRSLHEALDTTTAGGRLVFHVFAALAEFIRELIQKALTRDWPPRPRRRAVRAHQPTGEPHPGRTAVPRRPAPRLPADPGGDRQGRRGRPRHHRYAARGILRRVVRQPHRQGRRRVQSPPPRLRHPDPGVAAPRGIRAAACARTRPPAHRTPGRRTRHHHRAHRLLHPPCPRRPSRPPLRRTLIRIARRSRARSADHDHRSAAVLAGLPPSQPHSRGQAHPARSGDRRMAGSPLADQRGHAFVQTLLTVASQHSGDTTTSRATSANEASDGWPPPS